MFCVLVWSNLQELYANFLLRKLANIAVSLAFEFSLISLRCHTGIMHNRGCITSLIGDHKNDIGRSKRGFLG